MSTLGNRADLFPSSDYVSKYITNPPASYDIPAEALKDETFATLITEAEKYLGYPYVWGGSSPSTSFDYRHSPSVQLLSGSEASQAMSRAPAERRRGETPVELRQQPSVFCFLFLDRSKHFSITDKS